MEVLTTLKEALTQGSTVKVRETVQKALAGGIGYDQILNAMLETMEVIGQRFKRNEIFVPEVLIISRAFNMGMEIIAPMMKTGDGLYLGKVIIGTVQGDLHDIGKNLVKMMLVGAGFEVIDLGVNVTPAKFVEAVQAHQPQILAMSALLTTTLLQLNKTVHALAAAGLKENLIIMVGGAPVTETYAKEIGAHYYTADAASAAEVAKRALKGRE